MRISDWSSDVCSSDLVQSVRRAARGNDVAVIVEHGEGVVVLQGSRMVLRQRGRGGDIEPGGFLFGVLVHASLARGRVPYLLVRSEERRVGKECVRSLRSRGSR